MFCVGAVTGKRTLVRGVFDRRLIYNVDGGCIQMFLHICNLYGHTEGVGRVIRVGRGLEGDIQNYLSQVFNVSSVDAVPGRSTFNKHIDLNCLLR